MERLVDGLRQLLGLLDQPVVLGAGPGDPDCIRLLEGVVADHEGWNLPRKHHERDRIHQRIDKAGDRVGRAGAGRDQHDAGPAGRASVTFGGVGRALFVAHEDVADLVLLEQLVIDRQNRSARIAEHCVHALVAQGLDDDLGAGHVTGHVFSPILSRRVRDAIDPGSGHKKAPVRGRGRGLPDGAIATCPDRARLGSPHHPSRLSSERAS